MRRYPAISIHAPRVGGDIGPMEFWRTADISIHAPRVGGDVCEILGRGLDALFQSTPPVWGATSTVTVGASLE